jgi:hypothetical protein
MTAIAVLVLLIAGCAAPTAGDLRFVTSAVETESARAPADAASCITRAAMDTQGAFGSTHSAGMTETARGWEVTMRSGQGVTGYALIEQAGNGSRITTWEAGERQMLRAANGCR